MKIRQLTHIETLFGKRLPAWALLAYQEPAPHHPTRYLWVEDVTSCGYERFKIYQMDCSTDRVTFWWADVRRDSIARLFAKFADNLPLECIRRPQWEKASDIRVMGPQDRKPQVFDAPRKKPDNVKAINNRSVIDGCRVGAYRHNEESYHTVVLGMESVSFRKHGFDGLNVDNLELPSVF